MRFCKMCDICANFRIAKMFHIPRFAKQSGSRNHEIFMLQKFSLLQYFIIDISFFFLQGEAKTYPPSDEKQRIKLRWPYSVDFRYVP